MSDTTTEKKWQPLSLKRKAFIKELVNNPKQSPTAAVKQVYGKPDKPVTDGTARVMAHELMHNEQIQSELAVYLGQAELNLIKVANAATDYALQGGRDGAAYASVAEKTNNSIIDRLKGKATQQIQVQSEVVTISIDLTDAAS